MERGGFNIGLAMAGAASAGAYTAGVFDFLVEALDEWQKAKVRGDDVPRHEVFISAISGSSAGGTTAALGWRHWLAASDQSRSPLPIQNRIGGSGASFQKSTMFG